MKRSKIFLGATTCMLAIAGVAAAKRYSTSTQRWYITNASITGGICQPVQETCTPNVSGLNKCTVAVTAGLTFHYTVYTVGSLDGSQNPQLSSLTNCIHPLIYTRND